MSDQSTVTIIEKIGRDVVLSIHQGFIDRPMENEDYISVLKSAIDGFVRSARELVDEKTGCDLRHKLRGYARELFVELWIAQAAEDGSVSKSEKTEAQQAFDEFFDGADE